MATQAERREATRGALVAAARALFAEHGWDGTATNDVVAAAGLSRGALYHHFPDKRALFEAVYEDVETDIRDLILAASGPLLATDPLEALRVGTDTFLDACLDPDAVRISLLEAPAVLGHDRWRELDEQHGLGLTRLVLQQCIDAGVIREFPVDQLAKVLLGALREAALIVATAEDPAAARAEVGHLVDHVVDAFRA